MTVNYGESGHPEHLRPIILTPLANGTLRAQDGDTGADLWSYSPPPRLILPTALGPLGPLAVLRFDANGDGAIDPARGDRVWIFFGLQNRGRAYIALDISARTRASALWIDTESKLPHVGLTWGTPTVARVRITDRDQNGENLIVLLPGGVSDPAAIPGAVAGLEGNRIYAVDAATGALLWSAGASFDDDLPDLSLEDMRYGLASRIVALDLDADGAVDRLYASDIGAQVWRVDLTNGVTHDSFAAGGRLASLGLAASPPPGSEEAREFFAAPDASFVTLPERPPFLNLILGSGNALSIDSRTTRDRLYSIRDFDVFRHMTAADFLAHKPLLDPDLPSIELRADALDLSPLAPGWKTEPSPEWRENAWRGPDSQWRYDDPELRTSRIRARLRRWHQ